MKSTKMEANRFLALGQKPHSIYIKKFNRAGRQIPAERGSIVKKIINGKRYDTSTAKKLGEWDNGRYGSDFDACEEILYRKQTGEYFLYGSGGARSKYAVSTGENWTGGSEAIKPLAIAQAQKWAEEHLDGDKYEEIFGEVDEYIESGEKVQISLWITDEERTRSKDTGKTYVEIYKAGLQSLQS